MTASILRFEDAMLTPLISSATGLKLDPNAVEMLEFCHQMSVETWTMWADEVLIACWGLIPPSMLSTQAYLWMHSTPAVREHQFLVVRHSQRIMERMLLRYPKIIGHCRKDAKDSIRWLRWLGAEFSPAVDDYAPFTILRKP